MTILLTLYLIHVKKYLIVWCEKGEDLEKDPSDQIISNPGGSGTLQKVYRS